MTTKQPDKIKKGEDYIETTMPFNFETSNNIAQKQEEEDKTNDNKWNMWKWRIRLNHLPFVKLKLMAVQARIPKELHKTEAPFCPSCAFRKPTRRPWKQDKQQKTIKNSRSTRRMHIGG